MSLASRPAPRSGVEAEASALRAPTAAPDREIEELVGDSSWSTS